MSRAPKRRDTDDAHLWISEAWDKLATAKEYSDRNPALNTRCALALDAAELAAKAVIIARNHSYRDTHDVVELLATAQRLGEHIPPEAKQAGRLNPYGGAGRYGHLEARSRPTTKRQYDRVIRIAEEIVQWAHERVQELAPPDGQQQR